MLKSKLSIKCTSASSLLYRCSNGGFKDILIDKKIESSLYSLNLSISFLPCVCHSVRLLLLSSLFFSHISFLCQREIASKCSLSHEQTCRKAQTMFSINTQVSNGTHCISSIFMLKMTLPWKGKNKTKRNKTKLTIRTEPRGRHSESVKQYRVSPENLKPIKWDFPRRGKFRLSSILFFHTSVSCAF